MSNIRIPKSWELPERLATPEDVYLDRRRVVKAMGLATVGALLAPQVGCAERLVLGDQSGMTTPAVGDRFSDLFPAKRNEKYQLGQGRPLTPEKTAAAYNNFYEFTTAKGKVWQLAQGYPVDPWTVEVTGLVEKPRTFDLDSLFRLAPLEERTYRFRCVERWAMQVPWTGYPLHKLLKAVRPLSKARYVRFVTKLDPKGMPGQKAAYYPWPYYEGLRMDEAMNELTFVTLGIYGHGLPMQHGAPWRIVAPWKYGYKSPKSLVRIELVEEQPGTFWNDLQPREYGFFSNVNPSQPHPRWSQAVEEDIGSLEKRPTLLYNGYQDEVSKLYDGKEI
ncbi:MAG: protein-methionine-sulfoxide reductase catalytic subunit MsrP [Acidobacteriota bacterium]